jgi:phage terminase large subunit-like protein
LGSQNSWASIASGLPPDQLDEILRQLEELQYTRLALYQPYEKQKAFHAAGVSFRERLLRAGNQNGKTFCGGCEGAYHLTGDYPSWWTGRRFDVPIMMWAAGVTGETTRDNVQRVLLGPLGELGAGSVPKDRIVDTAPARGIADLLDYAKIRHVSGGLSTLRFKYYEQGRQKWQGPPVHVVWYDEEPPADIYDEGLARTIATHGMAYMTFTPLLGMSDVVRRFLTENSPDRHDTNMTIDDALHIPAEERARIIASFPAHEREARSKGTPVLGSGRIFPVEESLITIDPFQLPPYWPQLGAMDFGWDHPFAAVKGAFDPDTDTIYITNAYRARQETPIMHAAALKPWGKWIPWAWPHDGLQHDKGSGDQLAKQYEDHGLNMMGQRATFSDGSNGVEAGLMEMLDRMQTGRIKVFRHLNEWFEEFRLYHRKEGKVVKEADDLMAATRYLVMMIRNALLPPELRAENRRKRERQQAGDPLAGF